MIRKRLLENITLLYLIFMVGIFPFFFRDDYLDIVSAKKSFFQAVSILFLVSVVLLGYGDPRWKRRILPTDICVMLFLLTVLISCMISPERGEAFWGNSGRRLGGAYLLLCGGVYIVVSRFYKESGVLLWTFLVANSGMWLLVVCDLWGLDPLGMYESLDPAQHMYFIGTMGNININSGYSGVCTALMMGLYHLGQGRLTKICFWSASVLGVYACCCTRSDSWLLAVGSGMLLLLGISMREGGLLKWCGVAAAFFCGLTFMKVTEWLDKVTGWGNKYIEDLRGQGMLYALIDEKVLLALGLALLVFFFTVADPRSMKERSLDPVRRYGSWLLAGAVAVSALLLIGQIFPMEDAFGNSRGYIWKRTLWNFREYPLLYKIFGYGPNCFFQSIKNAYGAEMEALYQDPFIDAHNECLQFLAVTGIMGAASYMGMQVSLFISCLRGRKEAQVLLLGCIGILAYLMQGLVNNPQVFTTPLYFIFLGIMARHHGSGHVPER